MVLVILSLVISFFSTWLLISVSPQKLDHRTQISQSSSTDTASLSFRIAEPNDALKESQVSLTTGNVGFEIINSN